MNDFPLNFVPINGRLSLDVDGDGVGSHTERGLSRLVQQFKGKVNIEKLLTVFLSELDEVEQTLIDIQIYKAIDSAFGFQLDQIGAIIGRTRDGYFDSDYRSRLKLQIGINTSEGDADKILTVWKSLTSSEIVSISENFPAEITLTAQTSAVDPTIIDEMHRVVSAGVGLNFIISDGNPFAFFDADGLGFGTTDDAGVGGAFVSIT